MHLSICNVAITLIEEGNYILEEHLRWNDFSGGEVAHPSSCSYILGTPTTLKSLIEEHDSLDFSDFLSTLLHFFM